MILFDPATARDVLDAVRLLEGRLLGTGRRLSPGAKEIVRIAERSVAVPSGQPVATTGESTDNEGVTTKLLTIEETSSCLGISVSTVRRLIRTASMGSVRIGRRTLIRPEQIEDYLDRNTRKVPT